MSTNPSPTPIQPLQKAMLGSTPGESAIIQQQQNNQNHAALVNATKGGRRRRYKLKGGMTNLERASLSNQMVVPIVKPIYTDQGAGNQTVTSITTKLQGISTQNQENAVYDGKVGSTQSGGKRTRTRSRRRKTKGKKRRNYKKTRKGVK
jgi:hypothetical protein